MYHAFIILLMLAGLVFPAKAPCEAPPPLSLEECVRTALEKNHALLAETENTEAARAGVGKALSGFLPKIDLSETYMRSDNPVMAFGSKLNQGRFTSADFAIDRLNNPSAIDNFNFRAQVTQPIWSGGKEWVGYRRAKLSAEAADRSLDRARQETVYRVVQAYYGVSLAGEYVKVAESALADTRAHADIAKKFFDQGMLIGSEVMLAKVRLAEVKEMLIKARNAEATAKAALNTLLARPQDADFAVSDVLAFREFQATLPELQAEALKARPDLAASELNVAGMGEGVRYAKTDYLPNINAVGRYEMDGRDAFGGGGESYTLLGMVTWNVFDGLLTTNSVKEARAGHNAAAHMRDQMREAALFEVRKAYYSLQEARERLGVTASSVQEAEESLRILGRRFQSGLAKTIDVLDAETALTRARTNRVQALYDYNVAIAAVKLAVGRK